jgi:hypothetical protein
MHIWHPPNLRRVQRPAMDCGHSLPNGRKLPPGTRAAAECAGNGTLVGDRMPRALYCLRHRTTPEVFPVTDVLFPETGARGFLDGHSGAGPVRIPIPAPRV